jgi:hypothetical protein
MARALGVADVNRSGLAKHFYEGMKMAKLLLFNRCAWLRVVHVRDGRPRRFSRQAGPLIFIFWNTIYGCC